MFCSKCGTELIEGAAFCQKCGAKVYNEENAQDQLDVASDSDAPQIIHHQLDTSTTNDETVVDKLDVTLADVGPNKIKVVKMVREWTGLGLKESTDLVNKAPVLLKKAVTLEEAEAIKAAFTKDGANVSFTNQIGDNVEVVVHCKACGNTLDNGSDICNSCGSVLDTASSYNAEDKQKDLSYLDGIDRKGLSSELKTLLEKKFNDFKGMETAWKVPIVLGVLFVGGIVIFLLIALLRLILSSLILMIVVVAGGYIVYHRWVAKYITEIKYFSRSKKLQLPEGMSAQTLLEALSGKFNYPYFKGIRYNEKGECVIDGQYSGYPVVYDKNNIAYLTCNTKDSDKKYRASLLESLAICSYINKFFNPTLQIDVTKDLKALKAAEIQRKMVAVVLSVASFLITVIIALQLVLPGAVQWFINPGMEVRSAYLTQYSDEVTIEEAFDNFFDNGKWSKYEEAGYTYVVFTGVCEYLGDRADVKIIFKITGENFIVDSLDLNGRTQNDFMLYSLLAAIYEDY